MGEQTSCEHLEFDSFCGVGRLSDVEGGPVTSYSLDVRIVCRACKLPFKFVGLEKGLDLRGGATMSFDQTEAHLVISPDGFAPVLKGATGFRITERSGRG